LRTFQGRAGRAAWTGRASRTGHRAKLDERLLPWLLLAPAGLVIFGLLVYPVGQTFWLSFRKAGLSFLVTGESRFVGLDNYLQLVQDPQLRRVMVTTMVFGLACVAGTMGAGLGIALLLNQRFRGRGLLAVLVLLPWAMPRVAAGIVWRWLFHDQYGFVNWALAGLGAASFEGFAWFNERLPAFVAIGVVVVWQSFPFVALAIAAGLASIPPEVREAARVDGAGPLQQLRHIILPMLKPLLLVLLVVSTIWDFKIFDQVYVMTQGGPAGSTEVVAIAAWREAFTRLDLGTAASLAMVLFAILAAITALYVRVVQSREAAA
jgi:N,N'-diacetylchitobiose transport system permease protein